MAVALVKQLVLVVAYPPFQGHDEVAHLGYLGTLANDGRLPTFSDTLPAALETYSQFTLDWPALYTANHPPLYYVTSLPAYWLAGDSYEAQLYAVRLMAVPLFLLTIWLRLALRRSSRSNRSSASRERSSTTTCWRSRLGRCYSISAFERYGRD